MFHLVLYLAFFSFFSLFPLCFNLLFRLLIFYSNSFQFNISELSLHESPLCLSDQSTLTSMTKCTLSHCPADRKRSLPPSFLIRRTTRSNLSMPSHALEEQKSRTQSTGWSFTHVAVTSTSTSSSARQSSFLTCGCFCVRGLIHHKPF